MAAQGSLARISDSDPEAWRERAACRGVGFNVFFPHKEDESVESRERYEATITEAKSYCAQCWSKKACLDWSIRVLGIGEANDDLGIYGGLTFKERRSLVRRQRVDARRSHAKKG